MMFRIMEREPVRFVDFSKFETGSGFESLSTKLSIQI